MKWWWWTPPLALLLAWGSVTLYVQWRPVDTLIEYGPVTAPDTLVVVHREDPFSSLGRRVSGAFADPFALKGWRIIVGSPSRIPQLPAGPSLVVLVANTYNWRPDWGTIDWARSHLGPEHVVATITLGAGSTEWSEAALEHIVRETGATLIASKSLWSMRPNDESRMEEDNIRVAQDIARQLGLRILEMTNADW